MFGCVGVWEGFLSHTPTLTYPLNDDASTRLLRVCGCYFASLTIGLIEIGYYQPLSVWGFPECQYKVASIDFGCVIAIPVSADDKSYVPTGTKINGAESEIAAGVFVFIADGLEALDPARVRMDVSPVSKQ